MFYKFRKLTIIQITLRSINISLNKAQVLISIAVLLSDT